MSDEKKRKKTYEPAPAVPDAERARYETMLAVLSGAISVTDGAKMLGLSRNHFQTLMHRGLKGLVEGIAPKSAGRPAKPEQQAKLEVENDQLRRENDRLKQRVETIDRLLGVAGDFLRGQSGRARERRSKPAPKKKGSDTSEEDAQATLTTATALRHLGMSWKMAANATGVSRRTLLRWKQRASANGSLRRRRGPATKAPPTAETTSQVEVLVRDSRGLFGAASLARSVGVSRRQAAAIKRATLRRIEIERVAECERVMVTEPGVVRGFDAMHLRATEGVCFSLVSADASVPYRTSSQIVERYDSEAVAGALERDFEEHGPPLVLRLDRAGCHRTPEVKAVLRQHGVLALHGPPRYPRYYGQLERQNREHRAWLTRAPTANREVMAQQWTAMLAIMNTRWRRDSLDWRTSEEVWRMRPVLRSDRHALREEVDERAHRLVEAGARVDAWRIAIEQALAARGLLQRQPGGHR